MSASEAIVTALKLMTIARDAWRERAELAEAERDQLAEQMRLAGEDYRAIALELREALQRALDEDLLQCRCGDRGFSDHPQGAWCAEVHAALAHARVLDGDAAKETK
jgi:hypothetical protein